MIYKNDLLNKNSIKIISYNYEESNGFSQETAVESIRSKYKEHKFVIEVENKNYEILFENKHSISNYAAMEDVFVNTTDVITDKDILNIKRINLDDTYDFEQLLSIENNRLNNNHQIDNQMTNFINKLIESANSLGIGLNYRAHHNKEDDFGNTYQNRGRKGVFNISPNSLFINNSEIDYFNQYLLITDQAKSIHFVENLENKIKEEAMIEYNKKQEEALNLANKIKEEELIEYNRKQNIIQQYTNYQNKIEHLLQHMTKEPNSIGFTIEEITSEIKQTEDEIKLLREKISLYEKTDEPYDEEYIIFEKYNKIEALTTLLQHIPEQQKIEEKLLKEFNSDISFIKTLINDDGYLSDYLSQQEQEQEQYFEEQDLEERDFDSDEDWNHYQYTKPRSLKERFESIRVFINHQVSYEDILSQLKILFEIPNQSVVDFLKDKMQDSNELPIVQQDINTTAKKKFSPK